ncbi:MAG: hypothetical protein WA138_15330 [Parvibaculum sp.]
MMKFVAGAIFGFLACVWAIQTTPVVALAALMQRIDEVRANSAAASQAYDALHLGQQHNVGARVEKTDYP